MADPTRNVSNRDKFRLQRSQDTDFPLAMESGNETDAHSDACKYVFDRSNHLACAGGRNDSLGVTVTELQEVAKGWSVKHTILGQHVYNDKNERIGTVDDLIVAPDKAVSYAIVNAGGFLGLAKHYVAIPVSQLKLVDKKLVLPGATKDALKASPEFQYAQ